SRSRASSSRLHLDPPCRHRARRPLSRQSFPFLIFLLFDQSSDYPIGECGTFGQVYRLSSVKPLLVLIALLLTACGAAQGGPPSHGGRVQDQVSLIDSSAARTLPSISQAASRNPSSAHNREQSSGSAAVHSRGRPTCSSLNTVRRRWPAQRRNRSAPMAAETPPLWSTGSHRLISS